MNLTVLSRLHAPKILPLARRRTAKVLIHLKWPTIISENAINKHAKDTKRPQLQAMIEFVREGDTVVIHSIDRLARNLADLESLVQQLNTKGVSVEFRKESLTFSGGDDAMQTLMLQMMGAFAQFERSMIRERQREGVAIAKAAGKHMGRPPGLDNKQLKSLKAKRKAGVPVKQLQDEFDLSRASVYRLTV